MNTRSDKDPGTHWALIDTPPAVAIVRVLHDVVSLLMHRARHQSAAYRFA